MFTNSMCATLENKKATTKSATSIGINKPSENQQSNVIDTYALKTNKEQLLAKLINQMVATTMGLPDEILFKCKRGKAHSARARQIAIYLMHTTLSFSFTTIGKVYSKDRTTVAHACHVIEDLRDDESFDLKINKLERLIGTTLNLCDVIVMEAVQDER